MGLETAAVALLQALWLREKQFTHDHLCELAFLLRVKIRDRMSN